MRFANLVAPSGYGTTASASTPPSSAVSNITPARSTKWNSPSRSNDDKGRPIRFGSVGGGGRYDGLVSRFMGQPVPATGFSIGVSRLQAALTALGKLADKQAPGPVVVTVFDRDRVADYQRMVSSLARGRHPRRTLSRQPEEHGQPAQIRRPPRLALRHHAGLGRKSAQRSHHQGPDPRRRNCRPGRASATTT